MIADRLESGLLHSEHGSVTVIVLGDTAYVRNVFVPSGQRGQGHGTKLFEDLTARADATGLALSLHVATTNTIALKLYRRFGFREAHDSSFLAGRDVLYLVREKEGS